MPIRMRHIAFAAAVLAVFAPSAAGELKPADLSPGGASASSPRIASDGAGDVVAVWREVDGDESSIRAAYRRKGGAFGSPRRISTAAAATESPELAMDRLGNAVAVWQRSNGRDSIVQAAVRPAGGTWSEPADLSAPTDSAFSADVAVEAGRVTAVWLVLRDRRTLVQSSSRTIAGTWSTPETISGPVGNTYAPVVAMDDRGGAVAAWQWSNGAYLVVQAALRGAAGDWSEPEVLSGAGRSAARPQVAMAANGDAFVAWVRYNGSWAAAQLAQRLAGGTWEPPRNLSDRGGNANAIDLALNRRGDGVVTWVQTRLAASSDLYSSFRAAGNRRWSARVRVTDRWYGLQARVAIDETGNSTAVWSGGLSVSASFRPLGEAWQEDYLLSSYDFAAAQPAVTTQAPREATALWVRSADDGDRVQSVFYDVNTSKEEHQDDEEEEEEEEDGEDDESFEGETFRGTPQADRLVGTPGNDVFYGKGGNDSIDGRGGRDIVYGGRGNDRITGGSGGDRLIGGAGADRILGGRGRDVLRGGAGPDVLRGGSGGDFVYGMAGDDTVEVGRGRDLVYAGVGDDLVRGGQGADFVFGGAGSDRLLGGRGPDLLTGGYGHDLLSGDSGDDTLRGLDRAADVALGGSGLDVYSLDRWLDRARSIESRL
ncbi:MAG TPA: calcium-binding protein [Gaiellaceae bacterium]|nr:calcium-binding protein [Gaiellaceae bacterium]